MSPANWDAHQAMKDLEDSRMRDVAEEIQRRYSDEKQRRFIMMEIADLMDAGCQTLLSTKNSLKEYSECLDSSWFRCAPEILVDLAVLSAKKRFDARAVRMD